MATRKLEFDLPTKTMPGDALRKPRTLDLPDKTRIVKGSELALRGKRMTEIEMMGKAQIVRHIDHTGTVQFLFFSDWHVGHSATDEKKIEQAVEYILSHDNVFCFFTGDPLEGINPEYVSSVIMQTPLMLGEQVEYLRTKYLQRLVEANKVLAMVTDYEGHTGWSAKQSSLRLYHYITAGYNIPLVRNGGYADIVFPNGRKKFQLFHIPPSGSTAHNPTAGLHANSRRQKDNRPNVSVGGHIHKGAVSVELNTSGVEDIAIAEGTAKGDSDAFLVGKMAANHYHTTGSSLTVRPRVGGKLDSFPAYGYSDAGILNRGSQVLDYGEKHGLTDEWIGVINSKSVQPTPKITFDRRHSVLEDDVDLIEEHVMTQEEIDEHGKPPQPADQYRHLSYRVETPFPFLLAFGGHTMIGGSSSETPRYTKMRNDFYQTVLNNPHAALLIMRGSFESNTASRKDRRKIVDSFADELEELGNSERILGLMLGGSDFRTEAWKKSVGKDYATEGRFMPGTHLATRLNTRLFNNLSTVDLRIGPPNQRASVYQILTADKLGRSGSTINTFNGLRRLDMQSETTPDVIVGGDMLRAGVSTNVDPYSSRSKVHLIAPGWFAKWGGFGKGNRQDASPGGQSAIFLPPLPDLGIDHKVTLPQANMETATEHHLMLYLLYGLISTKDEGGNSMYKKIFGDSTR